METLSDLNLSISYNKVLKIKEDIASTLRYKIQENNVYFPLPLSQQEMLYFAIDNADLKIDTPDGKNQLHGTVIMAYQNETNKKDESDLVIMQNSKRESKQSKDPIYKVKYSYPPNCTNTERKDYVSLCSIDQVKFYSADDTVWSVLKSLSLATIAPTWAAYNSLLNERNLVTTICTLPHISRSLTNWSNLSAALNATKKMLDCVTKGQKTICFSGSPTLCKVHSIAR